jgi:hypothetical protein
LVVLAWVDEQVAQDLAGGGVDHGDVQVLDEQDDVGSGVGSPDADVAEVAGDAQGDAAAFVDPVAADPVVAVAAAVSARGGLGQRGVERRGGRLMGQGPVRAALVVFIAKRVEQCLEFGESCRLVGLGA